MANDNFSGMRVLALESRRGPEMAKLIANYGGEAVVAPSMREVPLESNHEALAFSSALMRGEFDMLICLTGVGTRALVNVVSSANQREPFLAALRKVRVVARGPKPLAVLRELEVPVSLTAPEPNTWRELLGALDGAAKADAGQSLKGQRIAVQEYGVSNPELLTALAERGARVTRVPVYQWALPEDLAPLRSAIAAIGRDEFAVVLFTTGVQVAHLLQVAAEMNAQESLRSGLKRTVIASIGPTTTEALQAHGLQADLEPSHPKMGFLVKEAAERCGEILHRKTT